jgi:hypothetical protein
MAIQNHCEIETVFRFVIMSQWSPLERMVDGSKESLASGRSFVFSAEKNYSTNRPEAIFEPIWINAKDDKTHFLLEEEAGMFRSAKTINPSQHSMLGYKTWLRLNPISNKI